MLSDPVLPPEDSELGTACKASTSDLVTYIYVIYIHRMLNENDFVL
jgi:hypothetical protein